jgi:hypothetical protein
MSLLQKTDVYQSSKEKSAREYSGYGFILALICVGLALVVASVAFPPVSVGGETLLPAAYLGP